MLDQDNHSKKDKGLKALRKAARKAAKKDSFEDGSVVRWIASDRYTYVAVKTAAGWYTTSQRGHAYVPGILTFERLLDIVAKGETTNVEVATAWEKVS